MIGGSGRTGRGRWADDAECVACSRLATLHCTIPAAEQLAADALAVAERLDRPVLAADAMSLVATCRQAQGDLSAAMEMHRSARARAGGIYSVGLSMTHSTLTLYLAGRAPDAVATAAEDAQFARSSHDTQSVMISLSHLGLVLAGSGRYAEAARVFDDARQFGLRYGVLPLVARATSMSAGFHLSAFDYEGAEALQLQARELARSVSFAPSVVSGGIDLLLMCARRHEPGAAEALLRETEAQSVSTAGWHEWLWRLRLCQARAELALARGELDTAVTEAGDGIRQSRARGRPKYEALGLVTRAHALHGLGRTHDATVDAGIAVELARRTADPALLLVTLDALLGLDGNDPVAAEAQLVTKQIRDALPDDTMRRRFDESEVVQRIEKLSSSTFAEQRGTELKK